MTGRSPAESVNQFLEPLQLALSCVTKSVPYPGGGYYVAADPHVITFGGRNRARLSGPNTMFLSLLHYYRIVEDVGPRGPWRVITTAYYHALEDADLQEIIGFHWHPNQRSPVYYPHLHLGAGAKVGHQLLQYAHIPTGPITIEAVLRLAIIDLGVEPLIDREAALRILEETQMRYQGWPD